MPLYEYQCQSCGKTFEVIQKFADEPLTVHRECGGVVHRLLSPAALRFKGTGWYVTDYARGNGSASNGSNGHDGGKAESQGAKSETKPEKSANKAETKSEVKPAG
ncbi:MAG: FmdB family zinc ribbon protein [Bryobacteraceae bacterium]|jgi:putative FmdB family regulatory protein